MSVVDFEEYRNRMRESGYDYQAWGEMDRKERLHMIAQAQAIADGTDNLEEHKFYEMVVRQLTLALDV